MTREDNEENKDIISGLCPKVKAEIQREIKEDIQNKIGGNTWWCAADKMCNFPFSINGKKHYKPVGHKCIAADNTLDQEFTENDLVPCSPCQGNMSFGLSGIWWKKSHIMTLCLNNKQLVEILTFKKLLIQEIILSVDVEHIMDIL